MISDPLTKKNFEMQVQKALADGYKATFLYGGGEAGDEMAQKFAEAAAPGLVDAIYNFISQAEISGSPLGLVSPPMGGPVTGALVPKCLMIV